ncbi:hypothetical protein PL2TA16_00222 [Pseudoalteromonas luteoviolacea 2ta16]|uniref:Uncharacterized protein n=1 Tax=Pseudoalteromonas luteoviolacea (strain 2ta16) TaxID=1353533 RepID=V4HNT6_PSEL2|nr:hypothetical protein PL2TA16_00222 [Pseudoalteromonas luteoviolacea 2ta16]
MRYKPIKTNIMVLKSSPSVLPPDNSLSTSAHSPTHEFIRPQTLLELKIKTKNTTMVDTTKFICYPYSSLSLKQSGIINQVPNIVKLSYSDCSAEHFLSTVAAP